MPCAPVLRRHDMVRHPQIVASETVVETDHPHAGRIRQARPAARFMIMARMRWSATRRPDC